MCDSGFETLSMTGERCTGILLNRIIPRLADKHLLVNTAFMQDGASPHTARQVKDVLRRSFGDDPVLNRHFRYSWSPMFPDLNSCG